MGTKLTVIDNLFQQIERESFIDKDLSKISLPDLFREFDIFLEDYYTNRYLDCIIIRERESYLSYKFDFNK